jgi:putative flippase GtrA
MNAEHLRYLTGFLRFGVVGALATLVHISILKVLVEAAIAEPVVASVPAFTAAVIFSYLVNRRWTFACDGPHGRRFVRFLLVALSGLLLNVAITYIVVDILLLWYGIALILAVTLIPPLTYYLNSTWTFRVNEQEGT